MEKISVVIIARYRLLRDLLRDWFESRTEITVVGDAENHTDAIAIAKQTQPEVILLDEGSPMGKDFRLLRDLLEASAETRIILLASERSPEVNQAFLKHGARGIVFKHESAQSLLKAIEKVHQGELWLKRNATLAVVRNLLHGNTASKDDEREAILKRLTPKEREVIPLIVEGLRNKEIGQRLGIKEATVRHHLSSIFSKCDVKDRMQLMRFAFAHGLVLSQTEDD